MSEIHQGGCLCGTVRYRTVGRPERTTICHCTFCQRLTGSAFLVEPVFCDQPCPDRVRQCRHLRPSFSGTRPHAARPLLPQVRHPSEPAVRALPRVPGHLRRHLRRPALVQARPAHLHRDGSAVDGVCAGCALLCAARDPRGRNTGHAVAESRSLLERAMCVVSRRAVGAATAIASFSSVSRHRRRTATGRRRKPIRRCSVRPRACHRL